MLKQNLDDIKQLRSRLQKIESKLPEIEMSRVFANLESIEHAVVPQDATDAAIVGATSVCELLEKMARLVPEKPNLWKLK